MNISVNIEHLILCCLSSSFFFLSCSIGTFDTVDEARTMLIFFARIYVGIVFFSFCFCCLNVFHLSLRKQRASSRIQLKYFLSHRRSSAFQRFVPPLDFDSVWNCIEFVYLCILILLLCIRQK